jgi:hypothetical protein
VGVDKHNTTPTKVVIMMVDEQVAGGASLAKVMARQGIQAHVYFHTMTPTTTTTLTAGL